MADLPAFRLPSTVTGAPSDHDLAREMARAWRTHGIFHVVTDPEQERITAQAIEASKRFFRMPAGFKARHISDVSYSGYIASGEADYSEIMFMCCYPDRVTTRRILAEDRLSELARLREHALQA